MNINLPHKQVLCRKLEADIQSDLIKHGKLLDTLVNIGTYILEWEVAFNTAESEGFGQTVAASIFRRLLDIFDSCASLTKLGSVTTCSALIRIGLELTVELEYLLFDENQINMKAKAYLLMGHDSTLRNWEKIRDSKQHAHMHQEASAAIQELKSKIMNEYFNDMIDKYKKINFNNKGKRRSTIVKWYTLVDNNIESIYKLMEYIDKKVNKTNYALYAVLSNYIHSSGLIDDSIYFVDSKAYIRGIRIDTGYHEQVYGLIEIMVRSYKTMVGKKSISHQEEYDNAINQFYSHYREIY